MDISCRTSCEHVTADQIRENILYDGETFNEKYNVQASSYLFAYSGKFGFVGKRAGAEYVFFDGKPISQSFSDIVTRACCAYPSPYIKVYDNGALLFTAFREVDGKRKSLLVAVDLNEYL